MRTRSTFHKGTSWGVPDIFAAEWDALCGILYRPYFFRLWIVQEIVVAESCIIRCGSIIVERDLVLGVGAILQKFYCLKSNISATLVTERDPTRPVNFSAKNLWFIKSMLDRGEPLNILRLLYHTRMFKVSVDNDRFFALVGLSSNLASNFIDYNKDSNEIQIQLAKICLVDPYSWGPTLLSWVDSTHHSDQLPSWVPDWIEGPLSVPLASFYCPVKPGPDLDPSWRFSSNDVSAPGSC